MRIQFSKIALAAGVSLALAFTSCFSDDDDTVGSSSSSVTGGGGSSSPSGVSSSSVTGGGGKGNNIANYKTKQIGDQVWMAENLNYNVSGSKCGGNDGKLYDENTVNCDTYGRLYNWATAMGIDKKYNDEKWDGSDVKYQGICPNGWHLPNQAEWQQLIDFVGGYETAGAKLKATSGWNDYRGESGNGTDDYGFSALPSGGGSYTGSGRFSDVGNGSIWWSATEYYATNAHYRLMSYDNVRVIGAYINGKRWLYSVRCVQD